MSWAASATGATLPLSLWHKQNTPRLRGAALIWAYKARGKKSNEQAASSSGV